MDYYPDTRQDGYLAGTGGVITPEDWIGLKALLVETKVRS
jgi:hypothetical protein